MTRLKDTSVLVDIDRGGVQDRVAQLDAEGRHAISTVTLTELRLGVNERYERGTEAHEKAIEAPGRLCARVELVAVSRPIAVAAADIIADLQATGDPSRGVLAGGLSVGERGSRTAESTTGTETT